MTRRKKAFIVAFLLVVAVLLIAPEATAKTESYTGPVVVKDR